MAKIAFCWELGGGLGHIAGFLPIAHQLKAKGHEVIYILKSLVNTEKLIGQYGFRVFQAPNWPPMPEKIPPLMNYAEILLLRGYHNEERLLDMVKAWKNLLQEIAPDFVVFDHSPTAIIASRSISAKRAIFGTGFCSPPRISPMPTLQPWGKIPPQRLENSEERAVQSINGVFDRLGVPGLKNLADLFDCDENFLTTFPELDHYQERGPVRYWGARMSMDEGALPEWPDNGKGKKIFAYLKGGVKGVEEVLQVLKETPADVLVYGPNLGPDAIKKFRTERLFFSPKMLNLKKVCQDCNLVICHAGHATVARALLAGIPVMLLPTQLEQFVMAVNIVRFGAATMANSDNDQQPDYAGTIHRALNDENIKQKAEEFAARHAAFDQQKQIAGIVNRIEELMGPVS